MNSANHLDPTYKYVFFETQTVKPAAANSALNTVQPGVKQVIVAAVTNNANDWITLPSLAKVPSGFEFTVLCKAGGNFEIRTPASSNEKINNVDSDGSNEYLATDTEVIKFVKISDSVGWMAHAYSAIGAVVAAVVPHA